MPSTPLAYGERKIKRGGCCYQPFWDLMETNLFSKQCCKKETQSCLGLLGRSLWRNLGSKEGLFKEMKTGMSFKRYGGINQLTKSEKGIPGRNHVRKYTIVE